MRSSLRFPGKVHCPKALTGLHALLIIYSIRIGTLIVEGIAGDNRTTPSPITNYYVTVYVGEKNYDTFFVNSTAGTLNVQITTNNYETFNDVFLVKISICVTFFLHLLFIKYDGL
jgi:hypothetical protein